MSDQEVLSSSLEDYLEAIYYISEDKKAARAKDIAARLNVNNSSVTGALRALAEKGLVNYAPYDIITLTAEGSTLAREISRRHEAIKDFFVNILLVDEDEADDASCKMEHVISNRILDRIISFVEFIQICPRGGMEWIKGFRRFCDSGDSCESSIGNCLEDLKKKRRQFRNGNIEEVLLRQMAAGQKGKILRIKGRGKIAKRLAELGVTSGSLVEVERQTSQEDKIEVKVRGYRLSLKNEEAAKISVELYS
jgi:DtxR family Mn-dependent transcriptional regulator